MFSFYLEFNFEIFGDFLFSLTQYSGFARVYRKPHERVRIWREGCCNRWTPRDYKNWFSQFVLLHAKAATIILSSLYLSPILHFSTAKILFNFFFIFRGTNLRLSRGLTHRPELDAGELPRKFLPLGGEVASRFGRKTSHLSFKAVHLHDYVTPNQQFIFF